jgi:hypothetical protein
MTMMLRPTARLFLLGLALALVTRPALAEQMSLLASASAEQKALLAPDGTIYDVSAGPASGLPGAAEYDHVIRWSLKRQDGSAAEGILPGTLNGNSKTSLAVTYDAPTSSFVVLWKEGASLLNKIRLGVLQNESWTLVDLLPNVGFPQAYNPQMLLTHQTVRLEDDEGNVTSENRSILSVLWWEESYSAQARFAPIFLDQDLPTQQVTVYDLPSLVGGGGPASSEGIPAGAYFYPSLQPDGLDGAVLASFADLTLDRQKHYVVRITFPADTLEKLRRRIPVVGVVGEALIATEAPGFSSFSVSTLIGGGYKPTLYWREADSVRYIRFDGEKWAAVKAIALDEKMTYEKAKSLVEEMGKRN